MKRSKALIYALQAISFFFLIAIIASYKLWISDRLFPLVPAFDGLPNLPTPIDIVLAVSLVGALIWNLAKPSVWSVRLTVILILILAIFDQMRWQPWVYMYFLAFIGFVIVKPDGLKKEGYFLLNYLQILLIGVYFYSGFHKFNLSFLDSMYPAIMTNLLGIHNDNFIEKTKFLGLLIPIIEVLIAIGLFTQKFRKPAAIMAFATHLFIILYLTVGIKFNYIVLPWNLAMIVLVFLLFYKQNNQIRILPSKHKTMTISILILVWFLPLLSTWGVWYRYFSFNLYSENQEDLYVGMDESSLAKLDQETMPYIFRPEEEGLIPALNVGLWAFGELKVPVIPEHRVYNAISRILCNHQIGETGQLSFNVYKRGKTPKLVEKYSCMRFGKQK